MLNIIYFILIRYEKYFFKKVFNNTMLINILIFKFCIEKKIVILHKI